MSTLDLVFKKTTTLETIYDPLQLISSVDITVSNYGEEDLTDLGIFIKPSSNLGSIDNPADFSPEKDYQDLLTLGTETDAGLVVSGGLKLTLPTNSSSATTYVTRTAGSQLSNKIPFKDLASGESAVFTVELETPPSFSARRYFVEISLE